MHNETKPGAIKTLFLDIGGVLLTDGWGHEFRQRAVDHFKLDKKEMEDRHAMTFDTYEEGKLTLDEYLDRVIFYKPVSFSKDEFVAFMLGQSEAFEETITFFKDLKKKYGLKVIAVSNEAREINEYRIEKFKLNELFDAYISSCYVHIRKPDKDMWVMACDISQTKPEHGLYIDDRLMFAEIARGYGIHALHFQDLDQAKEYISKLSFHTSPDKQ